MEQGVVDSPVILVIKAPDQKYGDQTINCFLNWTVEKLKTHLSNVYPSKPRSKDQRLVYSGKLLQDHCKLRDVLRKQDEFHMLHLVCASRSPPLSPSTRRRNGGGGSTQPTNSGSTTPGSNVQSASSDETLGRLTQNSNHASPQGYAWAPWMMGERRPDPDMPHYPLYHPMTLLWWQQLYTWHYHMSYHTWATSLGPSQQPASPTEAPPREEQGIIRDVPQNALVGEGQNEEDVNRDWLDWVYTASRAVILLSIVYFYSSFSRFVMVMGAMLLLYLHQAGWLPFNLDNELQDLADPANQDEPNAENNNELQDMERMADEDEEEEQREGTEAAEEGGVNAGFLSSAWSFITTFFASLIPEGIPNAVN